MDYSQPVPPGTPPRNNSQSPVRLAPKRSIDRGNRPPRLVLPTPNATEMNYGSPYPPSLRSSKSPNPNGNPYIYPRKQSEFMKGLKGFAKSGLSIGETSTVWLYNKISSWSKKWFTHCFLTIVLAIYMAGGAAIFAAIEGNPEELVPMKTRDARYALIEELTSLSALLPNRASDKEWEEKAVEKMIEFEDAIIAAYDNNAKLEAHLGGKNWRFFDSVVYCATIFTTIGYGHMAPYTIQGQALTIVYAIIGIPLFLIALTDFGKLFTRGIKFLWSYVRRMYYTGSCRSVRKTAHMDDFFHGAQVMYEIATLRRPSMFANIDPASLEEDPENPKTKDGAEVGTETPTTPALSNFEIDDEFNLPISVAIFILVLYIFLGALMYCAFEGWDFFASFYFVFISMSTIGFGEYVPKNPVCMIASIVYLVFGLALMSMCINVVQVKLSDTFKDASAKLGATMGLDVNEDEGGSMISAVEVPVVQVTAAEETEDDNKDKDKDKKNEKNGSKKAKKSSMKVKTKEKENDDDGDGDVDDEIRPKSPKGVKF